MDKIILATDSFPYGTGEMAFVLPELKRLARQYDITIVSHADRGAVHPSALEILPKGVKCMILTRPELTMKDKVSAFLRYVADRDGRAEIWEILKKKTDMGKRLYQSLSFFAQALSDQEELERSGVLPKEEKALYYSFWYTYFCYSMTRMKRRYPNIRIVTRTHGYDLYHERMSGNRQPFKHQMEMRLDAVFFACDYAREYYRTRILKNMEEGRLYVCKLGTEKADMPEEYQKSTAWRLVSCSNVIPLKRVPLIIDALALLEKEEIFWTHIGDGEQMQYVEEYAKEKLAGKGNITYSFAGYLENHKVIQYYQEHWVDCFITTSSTEGGCPVSAQEAMRFGIPMIGTAVGGVSEMIQENGILLSANPTGREVAEAIRKMMSYDQDAVAAMRNAAMRLWEKEYNTDINTKRLVEILKEVQ